MDRIRLPDPGIPSSVIAEITSLLGKDRVSQSREDRIRHAVGRSFRDLLCLRSERLEHAPDVVVFPNEETHLVALMDLAKKHGLCLVPVGGATSVVGGVEPLAPVGVRGVVSIDLTCMDRILEVDPLSLTARVQCGILGSALEDRLNRRGLSLGHFPESFHYSTVGGWMAASSSGQNSTLYGDMSDLVLGLRMVTPAGPIDTGTFPAHAQGPDLKRLLLGSEGTLGIITEATLKLHPLPPASDYSGILFRSFEQAADAARCFVRAGLTPAVVRVSDGPETDTAFALLPEPGSGIVRKLLSEGMRHLIRKGYRPGDRSLMILGFEGSKRVVRAQKREALDLARRRGGLYLTKRAGRTWTKTRFDNPYLRDTLMNLGLLVETFETVTLWSNLHSLYETVRRALKDTMEELGSPGLILTHLSHLYAQGTSLYFIIMCPQSTGREMEQWRRIKHAATEAILRGHGALSHHHGVGVDHALWMERASGEGYMRVLRRLKTALDSENIMNPGKLSLS